MPGLARFFAFAGTLALVDGKTYFSETFHDGWEKRWTQSKWKEEEGKAGRWEAAAGKYFKDEIENAGLRTTDGEKFYSIAAPFEPFSNEGKKLIIQYQVKFENRVKCSGAYIKIGPKQRDLTMFGEDTEYNIMFGPDRCGGTKRTHLIFNYRGENVLKKTDLDFKQDDEGVSHLYRMILRPDNTVRVDIDEEKIYEGSLKKDWPMLEPELMEDPDDYEPDDWVREAELEDPEDKKPHNWVEEERVVDRNAKKPDDWDEDEDGEWMQPMKDNPAYKGEWKVRKIPNPAFKGEWKIKMIPNPDFVDDAELYKYDDFGYVGIDVWQVDAGIIFDNFIITDDLGEANVFVKKWKALREYEKAKRTGRRKPKSKKTSDEDEF